MRDLVRSGRLGVLVVGIAFVVVTAVLVVGWLDKPRVFAAAVPQPTPLTATAVLPVDPQRLACVDEFVLTPRSEVASWRIGTRFKPGVPLSWSLTGEGGYRQRGRIPGTWEDNELLVARVKPPSRPISARMCFRNLGRRVVDFYAAGDQSITPARTLIDGQPQGLHISLRFDEAQPTTLADRRTEVAEEMTRFRAPYIGTWLVWTLAALLIVGMPLAAIGAMWWGSRDDDVTPPPRP